MAFCRASNHVLRKRQGAHGQPVRALADSSSFLAPPAIRERPPRAPTASKRVCYCICVTGLLDSMGLCLSVAVCKGKLVFAHGRGDAGQEVAGAAESSGGCVYELLGGDVDVLEVEEAVPPAAVKRGAAVPARPIWQRRVLMGVRCELPRFSGMILYDERGRPVCGGIRDRARDQEKHAKAVMVLRDML